MDLSEEDPLRTLLTVPPPDACAALMHEVLRLFPVVSSSSATTTQGFRQVVEVVGSLTREPDAVAALTATLAVPSTHPYSAALLLRAEYCVVLGAAVAAAAAGKVSGVEYGVEKDEASLYGGGRGRRGNGSVVVVGRWWSSTEALQPADSGGLLSLAMPGHRVALPAAHTARGAEHCCRPTYLAFHLLSDFFLVAALQSLSGVASTLPFVKMVSAVAAGCYSGEAALTDAPWQLAAFWGGLPSPAVTRTLDGCPEAMAWCARAGLPSWLLLLALFGERCPESPDVQRCICEVLGATADTSDTSEPAQRRRPSDSVLCVALAATHHSSVQPWANVVGAGGGSASPPARGVAHVLSIFARVVLGEGCGGGGDDGAAQMEAARSLVDCTARFMRREASLVLEHNPSTSSRLLSSFCIRRVEVGKDEVKVAQLAGSVGSIVVVRGLAEALILQLFRTGDPSRACVLVSSLAVLCCLSNCHCYTLQGLLRHDTDADADGVDATPAEGAGEGVVDAPYETCTPAFSPTTQAIHTHYLDARQLLQCRTVTGAARLLLMALTSERLSEARKAQTIAACEAAVAFVLSDEESSDVTGSRVTGSVGGSGSGSGSGGGVGGGATGNGRAGESLWSSGLLTGSLGG